MLDETDRRIVNALQGGFPVVDRPFAAVGREIGLDEQDLIERLSRMVGEGILSRFGPLFDAEAMGGGLTLAAMRVPADRFDAVADIVNEFPEVAHNYARDHDLNMWFVVATDRPERVPEVLREIERLTHIKVYDMPKEEEYFLNLRLEA